MGRKLYVGNLPYSATESALSDKFAACGTVESCKLITDRDTGQSKGFGFIEMATDFEAHSSQRVTYFSRYSRASSIALSS